MNDLTPEELEGLREAVQGSPQLRVNFNNPVPEQVQQVIEHFVNRGPTFQRVVDGMREAEHQALLGGDWGELQRAVRAMQDNETQHYERMNPPGGAAARVMQQVSELERRQAVLNEAARDVVNLSPNDAERLANGYDVTASIIEHEALRAVPDHEARIVRQRQMLSLMRNEGRVEWPNGTAEAQEYDYLSPMLGTSLNSNQWRNEPVPNSRTVTRQHVVRMFQSRRNTVYETSDIQLVEGEHMLIRDRAADWPNGIKAVCFGGPINGAVLALGIDDTHPPGQPLEIGYQSLRLPDNPEDDPNFDELLDDADEWRQSHRKGVLGPLAITYYRIYLAGSINVLVPGDSLQANPDTVQDLALVAARAILSPPNNPYQAMTASSVATSLGPRHMQMGNAMDPGDWNVPGQRVWSDAERAEIEQRFTEATAPQVNLNDRLLEAAREITGGVEIREPEPVGGINGIAQWLQETREQETGGTAQEAENAPSDLHDREDAAGRASEVPVQGDG